MKFNEIWLREWINPNINISILSDQIINSGIEVESIDIFKPRFFGIRVGKIIHCIPHKKYHTLKIIQVDIGDEKLLQIICRASNCRKGIKVAVATIGARLNDKQIISKRIIGDEISEGMLCSFGELGLFFSKKIIEIDDNIVIGTDINKVFSLKDRIIKITSTPNRPDGLSILGLARNIASMNDLSIPVIPFKKNIIRTKNKIDIDLKLEKDCIHFLGRVINDVQLNIDTPFWMKKKLFFSDMLSDNIITNIINYILIEIGQPLNIINSDNISNRIIIRKAKNQEKIILENKKIKYLDDTILVISDEIKILSIPGNINSDYSIIKYNNKNIFLYSAIFSKTSILNIMKKFPSNNILEYYYYGIDSSLQDDAIEYATSLILNICGGTVGSIIKKISPCQKKINKNIFLYHDNLNKIIGVFIDQNTIEDLLKRLDYQFIFKKNYWDVIAPSWRFDIVIEEDVISDIMRIYGYNNIHPIPLKKISVINNKDELEHISLDKLKTILINKGYYEIITYSFISPKIHNMFFPNKSPLLISNPISEDMSCMRVSLLPGLLKTVSYNKNRKENSIRIFESGLCFLEDSKASLSVNQKFFLGAVSSGNFSQENWYSKIRKIDYYDLKGDLECILESIYGLNHIEFRNQLIDGLHPEQSASIYFHDHVIGKIGAIHPKLEEKLDFDNPVFVFEIFLDEIKNSTLLKIKDISKFPTSRRDISILIDDNILVIDIIKECKNFFREIIVEVNLFDVYFCNEFDKKKKSLGISFIFQHYNKTLKEYEINLMMESCITELSKKFQIILRK